MDRSIPKRVTIHDPDKDTTKEYKVMGTAESGSRGSELKYGKDGLVYGVCHHPPEGCYKAHTSGRTYTYHWE
tara:strand:- start:460 stop:675 length:216 start_codon:yes stop_codon:yes gene_type:complete